MFVYKIILFIFYLATSQCRVPDKVYCVNKECSEPISKAKTLLNYNSGDPDLISFRGNLEAIVYMKSAGTNPDLWYVKINEQSGFANSKFLRELKVYEKNPQFINPIEVRKSPPDVQPDRVKQAHEVIEGTTIYTTEASSPDLSATTEVPNVVTESATQQLDDDGNLSETKPSDIDNNADQSDSVKSTDNSVSNNNAEIPIQSDLQSSEIQNGSLIPSDLENSEKENENPIQSDTQSSSESSVNDNEVPPADTQVNESSDKVNIEQNDIQINNEVPTHVSPASVIENSAPVTSENPEIPQNDKAEPNSIPSPELSSSEIDSSDAINSEEKNNSEEIKISENLVSPETFVQSQDEKVDEAVQPPAQDSGIFGSFFSPGTSDPPSNQQQEEANDSSEVTSNEQESAVNDLSKDTNTEFISKETNSEEISDKNHVNIPSNPVSNVAELGSSSDVVEEPLVNQDNPEIPQSNEMLGSDKSIPTISTSDPTPIISETIPAPAPPIIETIPAPQQGYPGPLPNIPQNMPPNDQIPPIYHQPPTMETLPPIFNTPETMEVQNNPNMESYSSIPPESKKEEPTADLLNSYTTDAPPADIYSTIPESNENVNGASNEVPDESSQGFLSNMYSTLADVWPSTTEAPPSLYNNEAYPTLNEEKVDGKAGFSFMSYIMSMYYSVMGVDDDLKALFPAHSDTCYSEEYCDGKGEQSNRFLTFLVTTASSVVLFTLGYYYIDNKRQDGQLIGQINSLQRDLLFSTKECEILKEELSTTKTKLAGIEDNSFGMDDMVQSLKEEIIELKATNDRLRNSLDDNEKLLRVSENTAGELQNTLGEVENTLSELLAERANSEEQIIELNGKIQAFEEELISVSRERDNFQMKYVSADKALEESKKYEKQIEDINKQLTEANNTIELQKHEVAALKEAIRDLKSGSGIDGDATSLIDHVAIKAQLSKALEEKNTLARQYEVEEAERKRLSGELQSTQETLRTTSQQATEASTRLEVLGKYFQEREGELLKELSAKESLFLSKQGETVSTIEKIELMQQEVQRYKEKCDALTLELAEQETLRRTAVSAGEERAHAAWLEARAARRDADAAREDAAALRRKLHTQHKVSSPIEVVDAGLPPPLPLAFLPPPLLPPLPRPPPLGRLPSPLPHRYGERRYSPDSRYSPESRYSPGTVRYSPDSRYSPRRLDAYSPRSRRRSRDRYSEGRGSRTRNGPADTETEYNSDSPSRAPRPRRRRYSPHSGSSGSGGYTSGSDK